jgi:ABC-2 type transport system permease protein
VVNDYNSTLASILSIIPFTAPVVMMVRIPFINEFNVEILMSMISMVVSFILVVWMAGKIYRVGILMYGKKPSYKEILKWIRY